MLCDNMIKMSIFLNGRRDDLFGAPKGAIWGGYLFPTLPIANERTTSS